MNIFGFNVTLARESTRGVKINTSNVTEKAVAGAAWAERLLGSSNPEVAAKVAAVYACVDMISTAIAQMPLHYKAKGQNGVMGVVPSNAGDRLNYLLNVRPNPRMNGYEFKRMLVVHKLVRGNAFILPCNDNGQCLADYTGTNIKQLVLLNPDGVTYDVMRNVYLVCDPEQGIPSQKVSAKMMWHVKNVGFGTDGMYWGQSVLHYALNAVRMAATGDGEVLKRVSSGGRGKYVLGYEDGAAVFGAHQKDQMKGAARDISKELSEQDIVALPYKGLSISPVAMNSADLRLLETAQLSRQDIALFFHVPLFMLGQQSSNYKTPDAAATSFVNECLAPHCAQIENEIWSKYCNDSECDKYAFDFDEDSRMKYDVEETTKRIESDLRTGLTTVNELRAKYGKAPVNGGDEIYLSANLKGLEALKKEGQPSMAATPTDGTGKQPNTAADEDNQ